MAAYSPADSAGLLPIASRNWIAVDAFFPLVVLDGWWCGAYGDFGIELREAVEHGLVALHRPRRWNHQRGLHPQLGLDNPRQWHLPHARRRDREGSSFVGDDLMGQRIILGKQLDQQAPVVGAGGEAAQRTVAGDADLPQHEIGPMGRCGAGGT